MYEKVKSGYISTNSGIHHQIWIYYKGVKALSTLGIFL